MIAMAGLYDQIRELGEQNKLPWSPYMAFVEAYDRGNLVYDTEWLTQKFTLTAASESETQSLQDYIASLPNLSIASLYVQTGQIVTLPLVANAWTTIPWTGQTVKYPWITTLDDPTIPAGAIVVDPAVVAPNEVLPINITGQITAVSSTPQENRMRIYEDDVPQSELAGANVIDELTPSQLSLPPGGISTRSGERIDLRVRAGTDTTLTVQWGSMLVQFSGRYDQILTTFLNDVRNAMQLCEWDRDYQSSTFYDVLRIAPVA